MLKMCSFLTKCVQNVLFSDEMCAKCASCANVLFSDEMCAKCALF